jgi:hypothetical protein
MKWLHNNIVDYKPESLSGCLALVLRPMSEVQQGCLKANQMFPDREILAMGVAEDRGGELTRDQFCLFGECLSHRAGHHCCHCNGFPR